RCSCRASGASPTRTGARPFRTHAPVAVAEPNGTTPAGGAVEAHRRALLPHGCGSTMISSRRCDLSARSKPDRTRKGRPTMEETMRQGRWPIAAMLLFSTVSFATADDRGMVTIGGGAFLPYNGDVGGTAMAGAEGRVSRHLSVGGEVD